MRWMFGLAVAACVAPVLGFGFASAGCSSSTDNPAAPPDASTGDDGSIGDDGGADALPAIEQDPNKYPAQHAPIAQIDNLGGPLLTNLRLVTVTFVTPSSGSGSTDAGAPSTPDASSDGGADDAGPSDAGAPGFDAATYGTPDPYRDTLRQFGDSIVASDWWHTAVTPYGVSDGTSGLYAELELTPDLASSTQQSLEAALKARILDGTLPAPDASTLYLFYFPTGASHSAGGLALCSEIGGYHASIDFAFKGAETKAYYAVAGECAGVSNVDVLGFATVYASHEIGEAVTDPLNTNLAYYLVTNDPWIPGTHATGNPGGEVGDLCTFVTPVVQTSDGFFVSPLWSNAAAAASQQPCQPQADPSRVYYGAAVKTDLQPVTGGYNSPESRGYVVVKAGTTSNVEVDFFSEGPLGTDVSLYLGGKPRYQEPAPSNASAVDPIPGSLQVSLSRSKAHNGNGMWLTITVPATTHKGDYDLVIRSVLKDQNPGQDFNDWPFTVEVQ